MEPESCVYALCEKYQILLNKAFLGAIEHFYSLHSQELLEISLGTKASLINDYIFQRLKQAFADEEDFEIISEKNKRYIGYRSEILIRLKKLRKSRRPCINSTYSSQRFNSQVDMGLFPQKATNVYLGYVLNNISGEIDQIAFVCPDEVGSISWVVDVNEQLIQKTMDFEIELPKVQRKRRISLKVNGGDLNASEA